MQFTRIVSYLLVDQHTGLNLEELNLCFWVNLLLFVLLAAAQTGSVVSTEHNTTSSFATKSHHGCFAWSKRCSLTFMQKQSGYKHTEAEVDMKGRKTMTGLTFQTKRRKSNSIKSFFPCSMSIYNAAKSSFSLNCGRVGSCCAQPITSLHIHSLRVT